MSCVLDALIGSKLQNLPLMQKQHEVFKKTIFANFCGQISVYGVTILSSGGGGRTLNFCIG